jgi:hypothetical protein
VPRLLERRESEGVRVIPVILKPCAWQTIDWLKRLQARPKGGRPLSQGGENQIETDLAAIAAEIDALLRRTAPRTDREFILLDPDRISIHRLPFAGPDLFGREEELAVLDAAWKKGEANVFSLVAPARLRLVLLQPGHARDGRLGRLVHRRRAALVRRPGPDRALALGQRRAGWHAR